MSIETVLSKDIPRMKIEPVKNNYEEVKENLPKKSSNIDHKDLKETLSEDEAYYSLNDFHDDVPEDKTKSKVRSKSTKFEIRSEPAKSSSPRCLMHDLIRDEHLMFQDHMSDIQKLDNRIKNLLKETSQLRKEAGSVKKEFEVISSTVTNVTEAVDDLKWNLNDLMYMDDLLLLLDDQLDKIKLRDWPFRLARIQDPDAEDPNYNRKFNLIV